ncbi:MAG TPA: hypothetical protein VFA46_22565 [Actinomycetes bacterium]|jgi:hypothetical protein|nr:hypothetical protein [Actinomycetes bacterium]
MSLSARCGSCHRELLLDQLTRPFDGFRCPFCGFAFAPSYATVAPGVADRVLASHEALVKSLAELQSMVGDRLRLDRESVVGTVLGALGTETQRA